MFNREPIAVHTGKATTTTTTRKEKKRKSSITRNNMLAKIVIKMLFLYSIYHYTYGTRRRTRRKKY